MWLLCALALCGLVVASFPIQQIRAAGAKLSGLIGSYWVPCDPSGNPLQYGNPGLASNGNAVLLGTGTLPTFTYSYPAIPSDLPASLNWYYGAYSPNPLTTPIGDGGNPTALFVSSTANNTASYQYGGQVGYFDTTSWDGERHTSPPPADPSLVGSGTAAGTSGEALQDTLTAYFVWEGPDEVPDSAQFLLTENASASASVTYGVGPAPGLSATASATLGAASLTAGAGDAGSNGSPAPATAYEVHRASIIGNIAAVSLPGTVSTTTTNGLAEGAWGGLNNAYYQTLNGVTATAANATASANANPLQLTLNGGWTDTNGVQHILIGQACSGSISGLPPLKAGAPVIYTWQVTGNTFWDWPMDNADGNQPKWAKPPDPVSNWIFTWQKANDPTAPTWYWDDVKGQYYVYCTVSCTTQKGSLFSVTAEAPIQVEEPNWNSIKATMGSVYVDTTCPKGPGTPWLWVHGIVNGALTNGSDWQGNIGAFDGIGGQVAFVQVITTNVSAKGANGQIQTSPTQSGLDNFFPYNNRLFTFPDANGAAVPVHAGDAPANELTAAITAFMRSDSYVTYYMYMPPGGAPNSQWVPLGKFSWSWDTGNDPQNAGWINQQNGAWAPYPNPAGVVSPAGGGPFQRCTDFPTWSNVVTNQGN